MSVSTIDGGVHTLQSGGRQDLYMPTITSSSPHLPSVGSPDSTLLFLLIRSLLVVGQPMVQITLSWHKQAHTWWLTCSDSRTKKLS